MARKKSKSFDILSGFNYYQPSWGGMFALLGILFAGTLLGNVFQLVMTTLGGQEFGNTYGVVVAYCISFIAVMLYASIKSRKNEMSLGKAEVPVDQYILDNGPQAPIKPAMLIFMCAVATIAAAVAVEPILQLLPEMPAWIKAALEQLTNGPLWVSILCTCVFAPFFEEWLCRGMVLRGLLQHTKPAWAILASAAFFAFIHMNPWQAIPAFALGSLFGLVYYKTGSLKLTMLMHCVNNAFSITCSRLPQFQGKDYLSDVLAPSQYWLVYACSLALLALFVSRVLRLE